MDCLPVDYADMGKKIRKLRKEQHLTQEQFAELIGRSTSFIGHIERGTRIISLETFSNIVQILNCSANYLLGLNEEEKQIRISAETLLQIATELAARQS